MRSITQHQVDFIEDIIRYLAIASVRFYRKLSAKHDSISMLLEKYAAASVSKRNADGKLPIDLLWESNEVSDRESVEYTESIFRLIRANPEMINQ